MKNSNLDQMSQFGQDLLSKAKKTFTEAEVLVESGTEISLWFKDGQLTSIEQKSDSELSLRVINKGKIGITGTLKPEDPGKILAEAKYSATFGNRAYFSFPNLPNRPNLPKTFSPAVPATSVEQKVQEGQAVLKRLKQGLPGFLTKYIHLSWSWGQTRILNTHGLDLTKEGTNTSSFIEVSRETEGDFFEVGSGSYTRRWDKTLDDLAGEIEQRVHWGQKIVKIDPKEKYLLIFPPEMVETLLEYLDIAINGRKVNDRASRLVGKLNQPIFDKRLSLLNDPSGDFRPASEAFDDEGVPTQPFPIIRNGILKSFVYDLQEAGKAKVKPTGSAVRSSIFSGSSPAVSNLIISAGQKSWKKILKGIKKGLLVYGFIGHGQGNMLNGDFSLNLQLGYLIDHGQIVGRVKGVGLAGNVFDLLKNDLIELSRETEWHGSICTPYLALSGVSVTTKE